MTMSLDRFSLGGGKALVTGGGRGIGRGVALALAEAGADVAVIGRTESQLADTVEAVAALGRKAAYRVCDLAQAEAIEDTVRAVADELGGLNILVNNAGINLAQSAREVTVEAWDKILAINLRAAFFAAQAAGDIMIKQGQGGRIINMSSQTGQVAMVNRAAYCASKAGLNLVTKVLALEWAEHKILVNAVAPTFVETDFTAEMLKDREYRDFALSKNLLNEIETPEDVAGAVVFLASPAARFITGHVLMVDAGWTAH